MRWPVRSIETALELEKSGAIMEDTMVYSDQEAFVFEGW
jgi:hypothetical protein